MLSAADIPYLVVASALATIAIGLVLFALLAGMARSIDLIWAGLFAGLYALRMIFSTMLVRSVPHGAFIHSALEYLVPIPAAALFAHYFGTRWRLLNVIILRVFIAAAVIAIPYEVITAQPHALNRYQNAIVLFFIAIFAINVIAPGPELRSTRLIRVGSVIFGLYVLNEHFRFVELPWLLSREPIGFLIFMICIVLALMRTAVTNEAQLLGVEAELKTARNIQQSIIPAQPPAIGGLDIAAIYRPASHVGGDFYEFVPLSPSRIGIFIADVSGHGVPAALVASMLKIAIAAQDRHERPADLLDQLNRLFCGRLKRQFFSAAYAVIDADAKTLSFASGGHPPLILGHGRDARELAASGFVLGRMADVKFEETAEPLQANDVVVMYTDGIVEASGRDGEPLGYERLRQRVAREGSGRAAAIADAIVAEVDGWTGGRGAEDDLTLIVVKAATRSTLPT